MKPAILKDTEMVVKKDDFGFLVHEFIRGQVRGEYLVTAEWLDRKLREWWPKLEDYWVRRVQTEIEVAIMLDEPPRHNREPLANKEMWKKIIADLRPPKSPFTVDYHCSKCKQKNVKLWRGVHGAEDEHGNKLLCASCLAPDAKVTDSGLAKSEDYTDASGKIIHEGHMTDQINGWLPAIPVDDTYWGYSSVPSQDVEWWVALPTYPSK